jgi:hypothetical protein
VYEYRVLYGNAFGCTENCGDTISSVRFENRSVPKATKKMLITTAGIDIYIFLHLTLKGPDQTIDKNDT